MSVRSSAFLDPAPSERQGRVPGLAHPAGHMHHEPGMLAMRRLSGIVTVNRRARRVGQRGKLSNCVVAENGARASPQDSRPARLAGEHGYAPACIRCQCFCRTRDLRAFLGRPP
jgi:hypothetical protein